MLATPMVIAKSSALTYWLWRLFRQSWIGLPNILLQTQFPECIQHDANPQNLAKQLQNILTQKDHAQAFRPSHNNLPPLDHALRTLPHRF